MDNTITPTPPVADQPPTSKRKTPHPMQTHIGQWTTDGAGNKIFILHYQSINGILPAKELHAKLSELGPGTYDIINGRTSQVELTEKTVAVFS